LHVIDEGSLWTMAEQTPSLSALALLVFWFLKHLREERELRDQQMQRSLELAERVEGRRLEALQRVCGECRQAQRESTAVVRESTRVIALCTAALEEAERRREAHAPSARGAA
jgi:hypothetical protein